MAEPTKEELLAAFPQMLYTDNGPVAKSRVFQRVMQFLNVEVQTHLPAGKDGRLVTARSKGKVERQTSAALPREWLLNSFLQPL